MFTPVYIAYIHVLQWIHCKRTFVSPYDLTVYIEFTVNSKIEVRLQWIYCNGKIDMCYIELRLILKPYIFHQVTSELQKIKTNHFVLLKIYRTWTICGAVDWSLVYRNQDDDDDDDDDDDNDDRDAVFTSTSTFRSVWMAWWTSNTITCNENSYYYMFIFVACMCVRVCVESKWGRETERVDRKSIMINDMNIVTLGDV